MSLSCPWIRDLPELKTGHGLNILNDKTQEGLMLRLNMGDTLRLDSQALPDALLPCCIFSSVDVL